MILITGATGYIGEAVTRYFFSKSQEICIYRREGKNETLFSSKILQHTGDICDKNALKHAMKNVDTIIHLAAVIQAKSEEEYEQVNIEGTRNALECARIAGVKLFVYLSSMDVKNSILSSYSQSKKMAEQLVYDSGVPFIIVRPSVIYGGKKEKTFRQVQQFMKKFRMVPLIGLASPKMQPLHLQNLVELLFLAATELPHSHIYEIGGPEALTQREIYERIAQKIGIKVLFVPVPLFIFTLALFPFMLFSSRAYFFWEKLRLLTMDKVVDNAPLFTQVSLSLRFFEGNLE